MQNVEYQLSNIEEMLLAQKRILNVKELSCYTGFSVSFIYKLTAAKKIPYSCPNGKLIIFDRLLVDEWLLSKPVYPERTIDDEAINYITAKPWEGGAKK